MKCLLLWAAIALTVAGCANGPEVVRVGTGPGAIELRWANAAGDFAAARARAAVHCRAWGGRPTLERVTMDRDETLARFACG